MKTLSLLCMACMVMLLHACQKENIPSQEPDEKEKPSHTINYFSLPPGGENINLKFTNGKSLSLYRSDTTYFLERDIALTPHQVEQLKLINADNARTYIAEFVKHWLGGRVPYTFNANLTTASRNTILAAMADWEAAVPSLDFVARTTHTHWIEFKASTGNNSPLGMTGGKQTINLIQDPTWGVDLTSSTHEIGHSLGMFHEQSRTDRDNFITINWANIKDNMEYNFQTYAQQGIPGAQIGAFDFNSIMLYPSLITDANFVHNTTIPAITRLNGTTWGWNFWLSAGDAETAVFLYGPPFARIRYESTDLSSSWDEVYVVSDIFIDFFADPACTIPTTLTTSKTIAVKVYVDQYWGGWQPTTVTQYNINLPTNVSSVQLEDDITSEYTRYDYGNLVSSYRQSNSYFAGFIR